MVLKSSVTLILVVFILGSVLSGASSIGVSSGAKVSVIVGFHSVPDIALLRQNDAVIHEVYSLIPAAFVSLPQAAVAQLEANPEVAYVCGDDKLNIAGSVSATINDGLNWGVNAVNASQAWNQSLGNGIKIAVLDTGVGPVSAYPVYGGYNFVDNNGNFSDDNGHGTMCAGIIAASINSALGVVGVAPEAQIYAVKIMNSQGVGTVAEAVDGIQWAVDNGMQIISMSWTINDINGALQSAVQAAYDKGLLLVAAAGNSGDVESGVGCPASYTPVIAVSAIEQDYTRLTDSAFGSKIELTAPGEMIYSTWLYNELGQGNGTSMAAAFVSGTAALVWAKNPSLTNADVRAILDDTATDLGTPDRNIYYGFGLINASAAVLATPSDLNVGFSLNPSAVYNGEQATFNASESFGEVTGYTSYSWIFGDGSSATTDSPVITHTYAVENNYNVRLVVNDTFGFVNSTSQTVSVLEDSTPPVTTNNYDGSLHTSPFTIILTAYDDQSGVAETYYRINGGFVETVSADGQPFITSNSLNNTLEYWSVDFSGNQETPHFLTNIELNITLDSNPGGSSNVQQTPSPPSGSPSPTLNPTTPDSNNTPSDSMGTNGTLPNKSLIFPFWVIGIVAITLAVALTLAVVSWMKRKPLH